MYTGIIYMLPIYGCLVKAAHRHRPDFYSSKPHPLGAHPDDHPLKPNNWLLRA